MTIDLFLLYFIAIPIAVYGLSRIIFTAYFKSKANYLRRFFHGNGETKNGNEE